MNPEAEVFLRRPSDPLFGMDRTELDDERPGRGNRSGPGRGPQNPAPGATGPPPETHEEPEQQPPPQRPNGAEAIVSFNGTTNSPTVAAGAIIGGAVGGAFGALLGGIGGSFFGVGLNVSWVPSSGTLYIGAAGVFAPALGGGTGGSFNVVFVPPSQNPDSIASGLAYSATFQPTPFRGSTVVNSPGNGPPVVGWSAGTRIPVSFGVGYNRVVYRR